jgi:hypothetical protein
MVFVLMSLNEVRPKPKGPDERKTAPRAKVERQR